MTNPVLAGDPVLERIDLWSPAKGIDLVSVPPAIGPQFASSIQNMRIADDGTLEVVPLFNTTTNAVDLDTTLTPFIIDEPDNRFSVLVGTNVGFQLFNQNLQSWEKLTGPALTDIYQDDRFSFVRWNKYILSTSPVVGLHKIDPALKTYEAISGPPDGFFNITTLGNRVILARNVNFPGRVQWSVKGNSDDWSGLGSGLEDLTNAAGSRFDRPWSIWPISETEALIVCERGLMLMSSTDNYDSPFRFNRISGEGTYFQYAMTAIPGGVAYMGTTDFWIATRDGARSIGRPRISAAMFDPWVGNVLFPRMLRTFAVYHPQLNEIWWVIERFYTSGTQFPGATFVLAYSLLHDSWSIYPYTGSNLGQMVYAQGTHSDTYDRLGGTYNDQNSTLFDQLGAGEQRSWHMYGAPGNGNNLSRLVNTSATVTYFHVASGDIELDRPDYRVTVSYVRILYSTRDTNERPIKIEYSLNGGAWQTYGTFNTIPYVSTDPVNSVHVATIHKTLTGHTVRFRVSNGTVQVPANFRLVQASVILAKEGASYAA